jgi:hypothetical protein
MIPIRCGDILLSQPLGNGSVSKHHELLDEQMAAVTFTLDEDPFFAQPIALSSEGSSDVSDVQAITIQLLGPQLGVLQQ